MEIAGAEKLRGLEQEIFKLDQLLVEVELDKSAKREFVAEKSWARPAPPGRGAF